MSETRARIVAATGELFRTQGFNGTSLTQITKGADAPTGSIYHFFPGGKEALGAVVVRESGAAYLALFEIIADEAPDIVTAIGSFFDAASDVLEETNYIDICPIGNIAREVASTHEPLREATADVFTSWTEAIGGRLAAAGAGDEDAASLASTLVAAIEGGFMLARAHRSTNNLRLTGAHMQKLVAAAVAAS